MTLEAVEAGHVIAALGMAVKLAVEHVEENWTASLGLITHAVDAIVRLGAQLRTITPLGQVEFGGYELVLARVTSDQITTSLATRPPRSMRPDHHKNDGINGLTGHRVTP